MELLLHICCAPCSIVSWEHFCCLGYAPRGYFFNPNIHPYREFTRRLATLRDFAAREERPVIFNEEYLLEDFLHTTAASAGNRCRKCYEMRLQQTARKAKETGIGHYSTTLLISPYQDHKILKEVAEAAALRHGVSFVYADLRAGFHQSMEKARQHDLYRQGYCGCIFSEKERYHKQKTFDRGQG